MSFSQNSSFDSTQILHDKLKKHISEGLQFLEKTQRKQTIHDSIYSGEWQTLMCLRNSFLLLGHKRDIEDSNCFSVASTHNFLARIYLNFPEYRNIQPMLDLSFQRILAYRNGNKFNFWNLLLPFRDLQKNDTLWTKILVRRPTNYYLGNRYIHNAANIVDDADDSSMSFTAMLLRKKILNRDSISSSFLTDSIQLSSVFSNYRDLNRKNRHWYNYVFGNDHNTGAFVTWLGNEYQFKHWNIVSVLGHNATFFLPFSECFPHPYVPYIPYGSNDLDAVVNSNILTALAYKNELNADGASDAIKYIEKKTEKRNYNRVGFYYPNRFHFAYSVSQSYASGVADLEQSTKNILKFVLRKQLENGSWKARRVLNKHDRIQSTAYAVNALIYMGNFEKNKTKIPIEKGLNYLFQNATFDENGCHWKGGVFFSGGTVVRNTLTWKSDAYTTALILNAFSNYAKYIEQKY